MTNQQLADKLTALAEKAGAFGGPVDLDAQNLLRRELVNNLPKILAALTDRSNGWREDWWRPNPGDPFWMLELA